MNKEIRKISLLSIIIALAMVLSYVDSLIHIPFTPPYFKIGIANIAIIYTLYKIGTKEACIVSIFRLILSSILFSNLITFVYSFAGAVLSLSLMILLKNINKFSKITVSIIGAIMHNVGQIIVAIILMSTKEIALYLPVLIITGIIAGSGVGILSNLVLKYTSNIKTK